MTDHSRYKSPSGAQLTLRLRTGAALDLDQRLFLMVDGRGMFIPTAELLAMIDRAAPDAMRAYLRETTPEVIADLYRPEIPEADSPEDVDERRDAVDEFAAKLINGLEDFRDAAETPQHFRDCASFAIGAIKGASL